MKRILFWLLPAVLFVQFSALGQNQAPGMRVALTTGGYEFDFVHLGLTTNLVVDPPGLIPLPLNATTRHGPPIIAPEPIIRPWGFSATFVLTNGTRANHTFTFPWSYWVNHKVVFTVYDESNDVVWTSVPIPEVIPPPTNTVEVTLDAGQAWTGQVFVPLNPDGNILPDGDYRLEATISGTPEFSADASFEVNNLYGGPVINPGVGPVLDPVP